ncbi:NAD(P)/FAD-dependent oxidoreductase [Pseudoduganella rivuli]|nr:FAD-dependent oxidoreductase [Pseudoduganella rivuli]
MATNNLTTEAFRTIGGWLERPADPQPQLTGNVNADAIIVGGGFAGLNTALELRARGASVVLLERDFAGFGASGRNAGYLGGGLGLEYDMFAKRVGHEQATKIVGFYEAGVPYVEARLAASGIACDYIQSGIVRAAVHASQEGKLRKDMATGMSLGAPLQFLDHAAMRARGIPAAFLCGVYAAGGGTLDPGKYVLGLRRAALQAGVRIFENSGLQAYHEGKVITAHTAGGKATAPYMVLATNAYTPQLGLLGNKVTPLRVSAIETEPLRAKQLAALGWHGREGIMTPHWTMESFRLTARNTIVATTKQLNYVYGGGTPNVPDNDAYAALASGLRDRFPMLQDLGIRACWSGYVSLAYDALPVVGETGTHGNVLYSAGCSGHGVATQSLMGLLLAERVMGNEHPLLAALRHKTPSVLPEPLQWCAVKSALRITGLLDAITNHRARGAATQGVAP